MTREHADVLDAPPTTVTTDLPGAPGPGHRSPAANERVEPVDDADIDGDVGPPRTVGARWLVAVGVLVAAGRWWFARDREVFHVAPDEAAQLAIARFLGGGTHWNMFDHSTWRPGLGTLVSPVYWFTDDGTTLVRAALTVNAVLGGIAAVVLARLIARLTALPGWGCALLAIGIALAPPALSGSSFVWAEALVTLAATGTVWLLVRFVETPRLALALAAVATAALGLVAHSRLIVLIGPAVLVPVALFLRRRRWTDAVVTVAAGGLATLLSLLYADWIFGAVWDDPASNNTVGTVLERLRDPAEIGDAVLGQTWYQLASTLGVAGIGSYVLLRSAFRRTHGEAARARPVLPGLTPPVARTVLITVLPSIGLSMVFMSDRTRSDHLVYGRYNDAVLWPVLAVGVAWIVERVVRGVRACDLWPVAGVGALLAATAAGTHALHHEQLSSSVGVRAMIPGLHPFIGTEGSIPVDRITVTAAIGIVAIMLVVLLARVVRVRGHRPVGWLILAAACGVLGWAALRTQDVLNVRLNVWASAKAVRAVDELVPPDAVIGVKMVRDSEDPAVSWERQRQRYQLYELYLPSHTMERDRGVDDAVGPYVFAPAEDPELVEAGAEVLWTDPVHAVSLWREPTMP